MKQLKISTSITPHESQSSVLYLSEIARSKPLTADEEAELAFRVQQGDQAARDQLIQANLRFVVSVAKQYQTKGVELSDLISDGNIGLINAAERFDPTRGFKFNSYAVWWIRQSIMHALTESYNVVRIPLNMTHLISQIRKASAVIEQREQRPATTAELAEALNTDEDKIQDAMRHIHQTSSTDAPLTQDGDMTLGDTLSASEGMPDSSLEKEDMRIRLDTILKTLPPRERDILRRCYGLDGKSDSLEEIGQRYHLSRERVRQLRESTIKKLQRKYGSGN